MAQLIVGLTPALASAIARGVSTVDTTRLQHLTTRAHLDLKPQHTRSFDALREHPPAPATDDDEDETVWFWADTGDSDTAELGPALLEVPGVTAAYVSAPEGPP